MLSSPDLRDIAPKTHAKLYRILRNWKKSKQIKPRGIANNYTLHPKPTRKDLS